MVVINLVGYIALAALLLATVVLALVSWSKNRGRRLDRSKDGGGSDVSSDSSSPDGWGSDSSGDSGWSGDSGSSSD